MIKLILCICLCYSGTYTCLCVFYISAQSIEYIHGFMVPSTDRCQSDAVFNMNGNILYASLYLIPSFDAPDFDVIISCGRDVRWLERSRGEDINIDVPPAVATASVYHARYLKACMMHANNKESPVRVSISIDPESCAANPNRDFFNGMSAWMAINRWKML